MGEKIRDLHSIKIGSSEFVIELNEGYTKDEGRIIHIQNKHFRYLINESVFLNFAATVLRAKSEMDYFKTHNVVNRSPQEFQQHELPDESTFTVLHRLEKIFCAIGIDYRYIEAGKRYITLVVDCKCYDRFEEAMKKEADIKKYAHPYGETFGYTFLYQMKEFELYRIDEVYMEVYFQLPCMSLTPSTWIPLDRRIQALSWKESVDNEVSKRVLDRRCYYIYRLCWAVFKDRGFSNFTIAVLSENKMILNDREFVECLRLVFFNFTEELIELLRNDKYSMIIPAYFAFQKY